MATKNAPDCHPLSPYFARGLCKVCYNNHLRAGTIHQFERLTVAASDFAARYIAMRTDGLSRSAMAEQLGMDRHAVAQAYYRAVRLGEITPDEPRGGCGGCGTASGYHAHRRRREPSCQPCKDAWAAAVRIRYRMRLASGGAS